MRVLLRGILTGYIVALSRCAGVLWRFPNLEEIGKERSVNFNFSHRRESPNEIKVKEASTRIVKSKQILLLNRLVDD